MDLEEFCRENDYQIVDNSCEDRKASEWAVYTIGDESVGIFSFQISPWYKNEKLLDYWYTELKEAFEGRQWKKRI